MLTRIQFKVCLIIETKYFITFNVIYLRTPKYIYKEKKTNQEKIFSPVCIRIWTLRLPTVANLFPQKSHT